MLPRAPEFQPKQETNSVLAAHKQNFLPHSTTHLKHHDN